MQINGGGGGGAKKACHDGNVKAFETPTFVCFGGGKSRGADFYDADLVLDLSGIPHKSRSALGILKYGGRNEIIKSMVKEHLNLLYEPEVLDIDWPDYSVPCIDDRFFVLLYESVTRWSEEFLLGGRKANVLVCCQGGHGRTGTLLSIFGFLSGALPGEGTANEEVVNVLRRKYCSHAVESMDQLVLIDDIVGATQASEPYKSIVPAATVVSSGGPIESIYQVYSKTADAIRGPNATGDEMDDEEFYQKFIQGR
jgi:hypothetical protein